MVPCHEILVDQRPCLFIFETLTCRLLKAIAENERKRRQDIDILLWRWGKREWVDRLFVGRHPVVKKTHATRKQAARYILKAQG